MRLFVAFDLRPELRESLREVIAQLKPHNKSARFVRPEGMHVTLKFIGHIVDDAPIAHLVEDDAKMNTLASIRQSLATVRSSSPVTMQFRGVGFFPDARYPRVIWCGVEASENLAQLAADIGSALEPLGIGKEDRAFVPHLTLARFRPDRRRDEGLAKLIAATEELKSRDFGFARETEFHLFESMLKPGGAEYRKIETYPFVKEAA